MDRLAWQREYRKSNGDIHTKRYERTISGKLMRTYKNMSHRITGVVERGFHRYEGLPLLSKEDFYSWSKQDSTFLSLFGQWVSSDYNRKLSPSIDRINTSKGYVLGNMRWITHSENSRLGGKTKVTYGN